MKRMTSLAIIATCTLAAWQAAADQGQGYAQMTLAQSGGQAPGSSATRTTPTPPGGGATPGEMQKGQAMSAATFIERARASNAFEIESSRLALDKAVQPALKNFARMMIDDHTRADQKLVSVAHGAGQTPAEKVEMEPLQRRQIEALTKASGAEFDKLYADAQLEAHKMSVQLFQTYAETGSDERLRKFAAETLPKLQSHLEQVQKMNQ